MRPPVVVTEPTLLGMVSGVGSPDRLTDSCGFSDRNNPGTWIIGMARLSISGESSL